jgi:hypothetical protein
MMHPLLTIKQTAGTLVNHKHTIRGSVYPKNTAVQVLVYSADGQWYLQKDAVVHDNGRWTAECTFGFPESTHGFLVVAIAGQPVKTTPVARIPFVPLQSSPVLVVRKPVEAS